MSCPAGIRSEVGIAIALMPALYNFCRKMQRLFDAPALHWQSVDMFDFFVIPAFAGMTVFGRTCRRTDLRHGLCERWFAMSPFVRYNTTTMKIGVFICWCGEKVPNH